MSENEQNKKRELNEDVTELFQSDQTTKRAYDVLEAQLSDDQLNEIDWEMLALALQAKATDRTVAECIEERENQMIESSMIDTLDDTLKNMGY